jgi:uncharacterized protein
MTQAPRGVAGPAAPKDSSVSTTPWRALGWAVAALIVAVVLALTLPLWRSDISYAWLIVASYALTWGPLLIALVLTFRFWRRFLAFRPADIYLGVMVGVVARAIGIIVQFLISGQLPGSNLVLGGISGTYVFTAAIAPVVLAPLIEEPFFRGLLQGSLDRVIRPWPSLIVSSVIFTLVHTIADGWSVTLIVTLLAYALLAGYVTQQTKRLAPAIIGHAAFNGLAALISWPW